MRSIDSDASEADWEGVEDKILRRRLQNRAAQRRYRTLVFFLQDFRTE